MIGAVWKSIIFTSTVKRLINTSRNERVTLKFMIHAYKCAVSSDCEEKTVSLVPRFLLARAAVLHFFLYKGTPLSETADTNV